MELRHLRVFVAVAEELHFGRAAQRLHLSQPPVSLAIKELETELGLRLFERTSRRIELTADGEAVLFDARAVLARLEALRQHAQSASSGHRGSLSVGFISLATYSFLPNMLSRFCSDFPDVKFALHESTTDRMLSDLEAGALDLGCVFLTPQLPQTLNYRPTSRYQLLIALHESHPLASWDPIPLEALREEQFLLFERHQGSMMFDTVVTTCMRHGFSPRIFHATQQNTIISLISAGFGVALVPDCVQVLHREGVVFRSLRDEETHVETGVAWRRDNESITLAKFLDYLPAEPRGQTR